MLVLVTGRHDDLSDRLGTVIRCIGGSRGWVAIRSWPPSRFEGGACPHPHQAAEGIVKGRWIMEISRF